MSVARKAVAAAQIPCESERADSWNVGAAVVRWGMRQSSYGQYDSDFSAPISRE